MDQATLPHVLLSQARRVGRQTVALREKKNGIWQEITWEQYAAHVRAVALGLTRLGLARGAPVAVLSWNRPARLSMELGAQSLGALPLRILLASQPQQVRFILEHSE